MVPMVWFVLFIPKLAQKAHVNSHALLRIPIHDCLKLFFMRLDLDSSVIPYWRTFRSTSSSKISTRGFTTPKLPLKTATRIIMEQRCSILGKGCMCPLILDVPYWRWTFRWRTWMNRLLKYLSTGNRNQRSKSLAILENQPLESGNSFYRFQRSFFYGHSWNLWWNCVRFPKMTESFWILVRHYALILYPNPVTHWPLPIISFHWFWDFFGTVEGTASVGLQRGVSIEPTTTF